MRKRKLRMPLHLQEAAQLVGRKIAELCLSKSIEKVAFDRGGHVYHGRIKVGRHTRHCQCVPHVCPVQCTRVHMHNAHVLDTEETL